MTDADAAMLRAGRIPHGYSGLRELGGCVSFRAGTGGFTDRARGHRQGLS